MITNGTLSRAVAPVPAPEDIRDLKPPLDIPNGWAPL